MNATLESKTLIKWKPTNWIEHSKFGVGQVSEIREDKLDIDFLNHGRRTILKSTELKPSAGPSPAFKFTRAAGMSRMERAPRRPPLDFDHLVSCFIRRFPDGFEGQDFHDAERRYKEDAAGVLKDKLGKEAFENLLRDGHHTEICEIAKHVLRSTNLVSRIEKVKFSSALDNVSNHERFAKALYNLLYGSVEMEGRFTTFCSLLSEIGASKWTVATCYQFLASDGKWMFMKPAVMKCMAESLKVSLNYKTEPNWLTYSKLQELADRVDLELQSRKLTPHSRIDVQGFIWASIGIEEGTYGKAE